MSNLSQIGQFRIETLLGTGEWTETYHAYDIVLRRPVALKLLHPGILPAGKNYRDFLAAAQLASDLVHPRIAWVWSTGELDNRFYIVERFVGGITLASQLNQSGPLPWDKALRILEQIAQATEFAEERQWVHGRVTPHNILLSADHGAVLSDYGLQNAIRLVLPRSEITLYDARYLAPEALRKQPATPRADQYSLACTLVEMLIGKNPFQATSLEESLLLKTSEFVRTLLPLETLPIQAAETVERALHAEPSARYANSLDFVSALDRAIRSGLSEAAAHRQHEETVRRWREEGEITRKAAEETARLAALDQARQEIHQRAHLEAEQAIDKAALELPAGELPEVVRPVIEISLESKPKKEAREAADSLARPVRTRRRPRRQANLWLLSVLFLIVLASLGGYWMLSRPSTLTTSTASPSAFTTTMPAIQTAAFSPTPGLTSTTRSPTTTPTATLTPTHSRTMTRSPSATPTLAPSSATPLPPSLTPTRIRPEKE